MPGNISEDSGSWIFPRSVPNSFSKRNISEDFGSGFFLDQYRVIFLGEIFLRILVVGFFPDQYNFFSRRNISDGFGSGFCLEQCQEIFLRILVVGFFLGQYQILFLGNIFLMILVVDCRLFSHFSKRNISEDFGSGFCLEQCQEIFLRILVVRFFLDQYQILFLGNIFLRILVVDCRLFSHFSKRNISEDFGSGFCLEQCQEIFLRILVVRFFLDQYQILFLGNIFLRILVVDCRLFSHFSKRNISEDFGSGFCLEQCREIFLRILVVRFFLDQYQIILRRNISDDFGSGFFLDQYRVIFLGEIFLRILVVGFFLDQYHFFSRINISEDFGSGFFLCQCQDIFLRILVVGFFLDQYQILFLGEIFLSIFVVDFFWIGAKEYF